MENLLKIGKVNDQNDRNISLYKKNIKLDNRINWSIGIQISIAVITIIIIICIAGYTISLINVVIK